ncbi:hypothetical protein [Candidatus Liberibacter americanus]|uniref:hypothetical protein n=1 Tax=Candidatus Liberibacter americanus TaxID=309868 RepID=UPI0003477809|nr:hypothetical protein [Candidatus Liberibacter americanus]
MVTPTGMMRFPEHLITALAKVVLPTPEAPINTNINGILISYFMDNRVVISSVRACKPISCIV